MNDAGALTEVRVPDMGNFKDVEVIDVLVKPGESVAVDTPLVTLESEKASMDVPSTAAGVIEKVTAAKGGKVNTGDVIATVRAQGAATSAAPAEAASAPPPAPRPSAAEAPAAAAPAGRICTRGGVVAVQRLSGFGRAHPKAEVAGPLDHTLIGRFAVGRGGAHPTAGHRGLAFTPVLPGQTLRDPLIVN